VDTPRPSPRTNWTRPFQFVFGRVRPPRLPGTRVAAGCRRGRASTRARTRAAPAPEHPARLLPQQLRVQHLVPLCPLSNPAAPSTADALHLAQHACAASRAHRISARDSTRTQQDTTQQQAEHLSRRRSRRQGAGARPAASGGDSARSPTQSLPLAGTATLPRPRPRPCPRPRHHHRCEREKRGPRATRAAPAARCPRRRAPRASEPKRCAQSRPRRARGCRCVRTPPAAAPRAPGGGRALGQIGGRGAGRGGLWRQCLKGLMKTFVGLD
jgi:hypothetical protein